MRACVIALLFVLSAAADVFGQPPPSQYPVAGRFGCIGYDKTQALPGDLGTINPGQPTGAMNNGLLFMFPSRNVSLDLSTGLWHAELGLWTGSSYFWITETMPVEHCFYYPEVPGNQADPHAWVGEHAIKDSIEAAAFTIIAYDGVAVIPGDLQPGSDNGTIFTRPMHNVHLLVGPGGAVWHGRIYVDLGGGVYGWGWAVWPREHSVVQTQSLAWLDQVTGNAPR